MKINIFLYLPNTCEIFFCNHSLLASPFFFLSAVTMWSLIALKKQLMLVGIYGISMMVNIIGNIILIPHYGYMAAAGLTVVSEGLVLLISGMVLIQSLRK